MTNQDLLQELREKDQKFTSFCETILYTPENFERFEREITGIQKLLNRLAEKIKSPEIDQQFLLEVKAWFTEKYPFYNTIITLNQKIKENWLDPEKMKVFMILFQLITKFENKKREVLDSPETIKNLSETISGLHKSEASINKMYQNLFNNKENILTSELPEEKREIETEEQYKEYVFSFLGKKIEKKVEIVDPVDLIDNAALESELDAWKITPPEVGKESPRMVSEAPVPKKEAEILPVKEGKPVTEVELMGNLKKAVREYEASADKVVDMKIKEKKQKSLGTVEKNIEISKPTKEEPLSEVQLMGNIHAYLKAYEQLTGNQVYLKIKDKKKEKKGYPFKVTKKASEKVAEFVKKKKSFFYTFGLCSVITVLGASVATISANLTKQYKHIIKEETKKEEPKPIHINTNEEILKNLSAQIEREYNNALNKEIVLPFSLHNSTFTIMPGAKVYKDEYLGLDGNDTERRPYYSSDTVRVPEIGVMRNRETGEILCAYSDEDMMTYLQNNWEVIGAHSFDGFYKLKGMVVANERGMKR